MFSHALGISQAQQMNGLLNGVCYTGKFESGMYNIPIDVHGNSVLTGHGAGSKDRNKRFTISKLEVFLIGQA